jgi:hypothetical protein
LGLPPVARRICEYSVPVTAEASDPEAIASDGEIKMEVETDLLRTGLLLSTTVAVKVKVPEAVGVPATTPEEGTMKRPVGRAPEVIDQL